MILFYVLLPLTVQSAYVTGGGGKLKPSRSTWAAQCDTEEDIESVRTKCAQWEGRDDAFTSEWVETCVTEYCTLITVNPECEADEMCDASALPTSEKMCTGKSCTHYKLGWRLGASWDVSVPKLVKLTGSLGVTKRMILPYIGFMKAPWDTTDKSSMHYDWNSNYGEYSHEYMEVDMWIDDLGDISNGTVYFDTDGTYSALKAHAWRFIPSFLRIAKVGADTVTDIGFGWQHTGPQFCEGYAPHRCTEAVPTTVTTHRKWYDLINENPVCKDRGLCDWHDDFDGYGNTVPSWRERKEMTMANAARSDVFTFFTRYFGKTKEEATEYLEECQDLGEISGYSSQPYYYHVEAGEGLRLKSREYSPDCGAYEQYGSTHFSCESTVKELGLVDNGFTKRVEAHVYQPCVHPVECDTFETPFANPEGPNGAGPYIHGGGGAYLECGSEGLGAVPFWGSCSHFGGMMDPTRSMAAVGQYPWEDFTMEEPFSGYSYSGLVYFDPNWSFQMWSNPAFLTYQPIPSGTHLVFEADGKETGTDVWNYESIEIDEKTVRFMANYYDADEESPAAFEVVINGKAYAMEHNLGDDWRGTYVYDLAFPGDDAGCFSYYFRTRNSQGTFTLPQSGKYVYRSWGIGTCREDFAEASCLEVDREICQSTCGFPGAMECVATELVAPTPTTEQPTEDCDSSLFCGYALTCVDGYMYPTTCGPRNCDEPTGTCKEEGKQQQECVLDCEKCGYNWYEHHYNDGNPTEYYNENCECCGGSKEEQNVCKFACAGDPAFDDKSAEETITTSEETEEGEVPVEEDGWTRTSLIWDDSQCENVGNHGWNADLDECKALCKANPECTAFNFDGSRGDCVLRACAPNTEPKWNHDLYEGYHYTSWTSPVKNTWQSGWCTLNGADQNDGVIKVNDLDGNTLEAETVCMAACQEYPEATGCEVIWDQWNRGCYIHTQAITEGSGADRHMCSIFPKTVECPTVTVTFTHGDDKYFNFDKDAWLEMTGESEVSGYWNVKQTGSRSWEGKVVVWDNKNGVHGRRDSGASENQWSEGDEISIECTQ